MNGRMRRCSSHLAAGLFLCALMLLAVPCPAAPSDEIAATRENAQEAREKLDDLAADLELRNEEYLAISEALSLTRRQIAKTERELEAARADRDAASAQLTDRAVNIYRDGALGFLDVLVGASDYQDLVTRLDLMRFISRSDATLVVRVTDARDRIETARTTLETRHTEQIALREQAAVKQSEVSGALRAQQSYLQKVNDRLKELIAAEKKRKEQEAARQAAQIAAQVAVRGGRKFVPGALGEPHPEAVKIARRYVNKTPYLWGGTTPSGFDCSGLVQYSYRAIGITIPRTSRTQYRIGAFIPADRLDLLKAGDLVFFGYNGDPDRIHHVGMYIGDGKMIHAPQAGQLVSVSSLLERISSRGDYVGACRP